MENYGIEPVETRHGLPMRLLIEEVGQAIGRWQLVRFTHRRDGYVSDFHDRPLQSGGSLLVCAPSHDSGTDERCRCRRDRGHFRSTDAIEN